MTKQQQPDGFRLSPQQRHLWRLQKEDGSQAYTAQCVVQIQGNLRESTLRTALQVVIQRHEILRTRYAVLEEGALPVQVIGGDASPNIRHVQLSDCGGDEFPAECDALLRGQAQSTPSLQGGPLLSFTLVSRSSSEAALLISVPALCMDASGLCNLVGEICRSYDASARSGELNEELLQYADLAAWKNELLEGRDTEIGRVFWQNLDSTAVLETKLPPFPLEHAGPSVFAPEHVPLKLGSSEMQGIVATADRYQTPVPVLLLTAWQVLVGRLTGQSKIVIGTACDGRNHEELIESLGLFERHLPLRLTFDESQKFGEALDVVQNSLDRATKRQDFFSWEPSSKSDSLVSEPYCPLSFDFTELPAERTVGEVTFSINLLRACIDRSDIRLSCARGRDSIIAGLHFDPNRYVIEDIQRLAGQYSALLRHAIQEPECRIADLASLSELERQQIDEWNDGVRIPFPKEACLHELVELRAADAPEAIAVVQDSQQITYGELNGRANQLARLLRDQGVDREMLVGICVDRSLEMAVGLLAIAKAGGAYLPMDPAYPRERLQYMLDDSGVRVLLTQQHLANSIPESEAKIVLVDGDAGEFQRYEATNPAIGVSFDNLSYVIYTSGSTGQPKGVMLNHQGRVNNFLDFNRRFSISGGDRIIALASLSFDMCAYDMFGTLAAGATIVMPKPEEMQEPQVWAERINKHMVSIWHTAPAMLQMMVDYIESRPENRTSSLRLALLGGDWIPVTLPDRLRSLVPRVLVVSMGGATECSMDSTIFEVQDVDPKWKSIPYGEPMKNQRSYVLDPKFEAAPFGVPGELYLGGIGVGRGYFNRPELTAERFLPDPCVDQPGARMYRTGDLAQWIPDGNLELLGRMDHQVKIRGYRIELGEIESVLRRHDSVREIVVVARDDERGDKMLVAYLVIEQNSPNVVQQLRGLAKEKLPEYMAPSAYVLLDSLPLTPNGKVDRRSLPAPEAGRVDLEAAFVEPRTKCEEKLAEIWSDVLRVERVGVGDNFFELGGHSLLATQVISRIRNAFDIDLPLRSLFEAPTVGGLAELVDAAGTGGVATIPRRATTADESQLPLSFAQERLWFLDQMEPESSAYNIPYAGRFSGPLNTALLSQLIQEIVRRHEALRTCFPMVDGRPHQAIRKAEEFRLPCVDLGSLPAAERLAQCLRLASEESSKSFDLTHGPLVRATLLRLDDQEHVILLTMHHVVSDGWSLGVLSGELSALDEVFGHGLPSPLSELPVQYADYAVWQRAWLDGSALEGQLSYWKDQLEGAPPSLELPMDRPRPAIQTFRGASQSIPFSEELTAELRVLSQREGTTLFMTLLAAFQTLMHRYAGEEDILVGTPIAGRNQGELEGLIGFFVNTLVMRADLGGNPSFRSLLARVRETALGAYAHQDLPFETLVDKLGVERDLSRTPLFQVMFALNSEAPQTLALSQLEYQPLATENQTAKVDLTFNVSDRPEGLIGSLEYNTDLFDTATIKRMLRHFERLLQGIAADPEQRISDLPLLGEPEREELLVEWNSTEAVYPHEACIHELFETQVETTPDSVSLASEERQLSYRELNARANQLARYLRGQGVGPDLPVGILMERSPVMLEGMLGVLKAGGAYLPLDPDSPAERLQFMIDDAGVQVVLTLERHKSRLPLVPQGICLDGDWPAISKNSREDLPNSVVGANLAYVIYTSGSTGRPKGVGVSHGALSNLVAWHQRTYGLTPSDRATQIAAPTFDASVWEIWPYLTAGSSIHIPDESTRSSPSDLAAWLGAKNITHTFMPTPLAEEVLREPWLGQTSVKYLLTGGDELRRVPRTKLPFRLTNQYGPTENTVVATWTPVERTEVAQKRPPIGRPIDNVRVYVLDRHWSPVPVGVNGELYIGGASLSRGYLFRADLTAERFVPDPFSMKSGARLYRTGDRCRFLPEGDLEFQGRIDHQVKIRGFRIELGEIEAALNAHPDIREATVLARDDGRRDPSPLARIDKRLVAYLVAKNEPGPGGSELRNYLKEKLPDYMVPAAFVTLRSLPLTPNGKIDRKALPEPDQSRPDLAGELAAPQTREQRILASIWSDVLRVQPLGTHDNFFDLGGDSILSIQIVSKANQAGLRLTPKDIFQHQTVAELAAAVGAAPAIEAEQGLVTGPAPLTPIQKWFFERDLVDPHHFNQAILLEVKEDLDPGLLSKAIGHLISHHDGLRLRFTKRNLQWEQAGTYPEAAVPFSSVDLSALDETKQGRALERAATDLQTSLHLSEGPLVRAALFDMGTGQRQRFFMVIHHLAVDGVSWRILLEDLQAAYDLLGRGERVQLPTKTTSFANWSERLQEHSKSAALLEESSHWLPSRGTSVRRLPTDFPDGENDGASSQGISVSLDVEKTEALLKEVPEVYHTQINDILLTAVVQAFASWTGQSSLLLDLEGHGREPVFEDVDVSRTVGWFTVIYPVLLHLGLDNSPGEALKSVKEQLRAVPSRGFNYGVLRYGNGFGTSGDQFHSLPAAQVSFNYLGQFEQSLSEDSKFSWTPESSGSAHSPRNQRPWLLQIDGYIQDGQLKLLFGYSRNIHRPQTIERLAQLVLQSLQILISHCQSPEAGGVTPSDFPLASLDVKKLNRLAEKIAAADARRQN